MSDLETTGSREFNAPVSILASDKLRAISNSGSRFAGTDQLGDPFAEVFARMAIAAPPPRRAEPDTKVKPEETSKDDSPLESTDRETGEDRGEQESISQSGLSTDDQQIPLNSTLVSRESESEIESPTNIAPTDDKGEPAQSPGDESEPSAPVQLTGDKGIAVDPSAASLNESTADTTGVVSKPAVAVSPESDRGKNRESKGTFDDDVASQNPRLAEAKSADGSRQSTLAGDATETSDRSQTGPDQSESDPLPYRNKRQERLEQNRENPQDKSDSQRTDQRDLNAQRSAATATADANAESAANSLDAEQSRPLQPVARNVSPIVNSIPNPSVKSSNASTNTLQTESRGTSDAVQPGETNRVDPMKGRETAKTKQSITDTTARVKLVQRVSRAFQHLGPDGGMIRLKLAPAELGSVRVEMQVIKQSVKARVVTETEAASTAIREHLHELKARLESFGMQVEQIEVETESESDRSQLPFDRQSQRQQNDERPRQQSGSSSSDQETTSSESNSVNASDRLLQVALDSQSVDLRL